MSENKKLPYWASILIGLIAISAIKVGYKYYTKQTTDKWLPFEAVTRKAATNLLSDTTERREWCTCVISTFKAKYPNGINDLSQDTLNAQMALTSYNCIHAIRKGK